MEDNTPDLQSEEKEFSPDTKEFSPDKNDSKAPEESPPNIRDKTLEIPNERSNMQIRFEKKTEKKPKIKRGSSVSKFKNGELETFENFTQFQNKQNKKYKLNISFWGYLYYKMSHFCKCLKRNRVQKLYSEESGSG